MAAEYYEMDEQMVLTKLLPILTKETKRNVQQDIEISFPSNYLLLYYFLHLSGDS
jgi:hypothetical protein